MIHPLTEIQQIDDELEPYLESVGEIFQAFRLQDSACVSYGVQVGERRFFVKHSAQPLGVMALRRAAALNKAVQHPALPQLYNSFGTTAGGLALVYDWVPGEVLYDYTIFRGQRLTNPFSPMVRFHQLPTERIQDTLNVIYDLHRLVAERGYIAVDFYDGCILYDFITYTTRIIDLDEYRPGPFANSEARLPGSKRFMAPEEFRAGAIIDQTTNVYMLGRTAFELLSDGSTWVEKWRGTPAQYAAAWKAVSLDRNARFASVGEYLEAWAK
jgi:serine/threonine-protein kinase